MYNAGVTRDTVRQAAKSISIIHEGDDIPSEPQAKAQDLLRNAEDIWFLGFGYDPLNVQRLNPELFVHRPGVSLRGTAFDLLKSETRKAKRAVEGTTGDSQSLELGGKGEDILTFLRKEWE